MKKKMPSEEKRAALFLNRNDHKKLQHRVDVQGFQKSGSHLLHKHLST